MLLTIHSEHGEDGKSHGGHPVFIGDDGKMKTGQFAGKTMAEAFGTGKPKDKRTTKRGAKHEHDQPGLFETETQPSLPGIGPGNHLSLDGKCSENEAPTSETEPTSGWDSLPKEAHSFRGFSVFP